MLGGLPSGSVDLVVTDPPYNIASRHALTRHDGRVMTTAEAWGAWDTYQPVVYRRLLGDVLHELFRVLRPGGQLDCWIRARYASTAMELAVAAGRAAGQVLPCLHQDAGRRIAGCAENPGHACNARCARSRRSSGSTQAVAPQGAEGVRCVASAMQAH